MRADAKKNLEKVAKEAIKNPLATGTEIANKTGLSEGSVSTKLKKLKEDGVIDRTSAIIAIEETDLEIVSLAQSVGLNWLKEAGMKQSPSRDDAKVADQISNTSQKRYSFLSGKNASDEGGEKKLEFVVVNTD